MASQETNNTTRYSVKRLTQLSVLLTIAIIIFVLELQLPPLTPIPGIKMGLSNIITLVIILLYNKKDAFTVLVLRIIISSIFAGQMTSFLYSIAGGICSFGVMCFASLFLKKDKLWVISAFGAIGHNFGQIVVAILLTGTWRIVFYFPVLFIAGITAGIFTGIVAQLLIKRLERKYKTNQ